MIKLEQSFHQRWFRPPNMTWILLFTTLILTCSYIPNVSAKSETEKLLDQAQKEIKNKQYTKAVELYLQLWAETKNPNTLFNISILKYKQRHYEESQKYLHQYLAQAQVNKNSPVVLKLSQRLSTKLGQSLSIQNSKIASKETSKEPLVESSQAKQEVSQDKYPPNTMPPQSLDHTLASKPSSKTEVKADLQLNPSSDLKTVLYSVATLGALSSLGLYVYAQQTWDNDPNTDYVNRVDRRNTTTALVWGADGLMLLSLATLTYTFLVKPEASNPPKNAYHLNYKRGVLSFDFSF